MKLSEEVLDKGRAFVKDQNLDGFMVWVREHAPTVTASEVEKTFGMLFAVRDPDRAVKLFDNYFTEVNPARDVRHGLMRLGCLVFVALGLIGGIVFLVQAIF